MADCFDYSIVILNTDISQSSVATYLRCGGIFKYVFVANFPVSLVVKEFRKSVTIWGSYGQEFSVFFDSRCRKTAINGESRSDRTRYHAHTRRAPPLPLASAAPRRTSRRAGSQLMTSQLKSTSTAVSHYSPLWILV